MKKVYFAGSIRGGREDAGLYRDLIAYIGMKAEVLTEHIGKSDLNLMEQGRTKDAYIYERDTAWLRECDLVIAECTTASLGVGYELAYAEKLAKPVHILYRSSVTQLSAMLTGDPYFDISPYEVKEEAFRIVDGILADRG